MDIRKNIFKSAINRQHRENNVNPNEVLSKKTYRRFLKSVEYYREQHELDRQEHPEAIPASWGIPLTTSLRSIMREHHERFSDEIARRALEYMVEKGLLVHYAGDYGYPSKNGERLPSETEIVSRTLDMMRKLEIDNGNDGQASNAKTSERRKKNL